MQAILISIGDELALGQTVDTNAAWLAQRLAGQGIHAPIHETVADDRRAIAASIGWASTQAQLVIVTGGLGPTEDDMTRQSLADALGVDLVESAQALDKLNQFFVRRGRPMAPRNRVQARHPAGTSIIANDQGSAPGIEAKLNQARIIVMPGVPREMRAMYDQAIEPRIVANPQPDVETTHESRSTNSGSRFILSTQVNTFGTGESDVAEMLGDLCHRDRNPTVGTTISNGICAVRIRAESDRADHAKRALEDSARQVEQALGPIAFGRDETTLAEATLDALRSAGKTLATAESCTGGLVGSMLTAVAGSSQAYLGGWITYTNAMKTSQLGVAENLLEEHGAVSGPVVEAMAHGALHHSQADLAASISGVAGPDGGTDDKPVGTVWIGLSQRLGQSVGQSPASFETQTFEASLRGDRAMVRDRAAKCAMQLVRLLMLGQPLDHVAWLKR